MTHEPYFNTNNPLVMKQESNLNLNSELESLVKIKTTVITDAPFVWRFATGVGEDSDNDVIDSGWILVS